MQNQLQAHTQTKHNHTRGMSNEQTQRQHMQCIKFKKFEQKTKCTHVYIHD